MTESIKAASERWITEGKQVKSAINDWIDTIYIKDEQPAENCPEETRQDMAEYVLEQLIAYNKSGKHQEFRTLFPPDNDPLSGVLYDNNRWEQIRKVAFLDDGRILAKFGDYYQYQGVYLLENDKISLIEGLIGFGVSHSKQYYAKAYNERIDIHEGWDGTLIRTLHLPEGLDLEELKYDSMEVFQSGDKVVLTTHYGIFLIDENGFEILHGGPKAENEKGDENSNTNNGPERPDSVPAEAVWNSGENEWEIGEKNAQGSPVGLWKWWLAPNGHLCCETVYHGENGNAFSFTRFHPDGTPSRKGVYVDGQPSGKISWFRSENPTQEHYPDQKAGEHVYETVQVIKGGYCVQEYYYDRNGNEVQEPYISDVEVSELIQKMAVIDHMYQNKDWKNILTEVNHALENEIAEGHKEDQMRLLYFKSKAMHELNNRQLNDEIESTLKRVLDLHDFQIWHFIEEHNYLADAVSFAKESLGISTEEEPAKTDFNYEYLDYPHAAISPDDQYIALGSQDSPHIILSRQDGKYIPTASIDPRSSYPNIACFNYRHTSAGPLLALGSCHFSQSGTLGVWVDKIEGLNASGWDMDSDALYVVDDKRWIFSMIESGIGFVQGGNDGYIWIKWAHNSPPMYIHVGGTILSMDFSKDRNRLVVGTHTGQVVVLKFREDMPAVPAEGTTGRVDPYLITNLSVVDEKRYLFMTDEQPLIW